MRETLLTRNDENVGFGLFDSIEWALTCHVLKSDTKAYNSAVLYGSEDSPERIDFYTQAEPLITDAPAFVWYTSEVKA